MTIREMLARVRNALLTGGAAVGDPDQHAQLVVSYALELSVTELIVQQSVDLSSEQISRIESVLARRLQGEPLQYIRGYEWFWKHRFEVGPGVLIPRPETELLVEVVLSHVRPDMRIAELGVGSGNIGTSVLADLARLEWYGFESSLLAADFAARNIASVLGAMAPAFNLIRGEFFESAAEWAPYDGLVSNPPYVKSAEVSGLSREVQFEPREALDGGLTGLEVVEKLCQKAPSIVRSGGFVALEIGDDQGEWALKLFSDSGYEQVTVLRDLAGRDRVLQAILP